jgi:hypothetical protein
MLSCLHLLVAWCLLAWAVGSTALGASCEGAAGDAGAALPGQAALDALGEWLHEAVLPGQQKPPPAVRFVVDDGFAGGGTVAVRRIQRGAVVLIVDSSILLTPEMTQQHLPAALHAAVSHMRPAASLGMLLLYGHDERNRESDLAQKFRPYFQALAPPSCLEQWTTSEAQEFQDRHIYDKAVGDSQTHSDEWAVLREFAGADDLGFWTLENYITFKCTVEQRMITMKTYDDVEERWAKHYVFPGGDMLNHGGAASNTDIREQAFGATPASATTPMQIRDFFKAANQSLVFTAASDIEAGQPVTFNYTRTNVCLTLVLVWGFYSQGCTNSIVLTVPLAPNEVSKQHLDILDTNLGSPTSESGSYEFIVSSGEFARCGLPRPYLAAARALMLPDDGALAGTAFQGKPCSVYCEFKVLLRLSRELKAEQAQYPTTVEEDRAILADEISPPRLLLAVQLRLGTKVLRLQVLQHMERTMAQLEDAAASVATDQDAEVSPGLALRLLGCEHEDYAAALDD